MLLSRSNDAISFLSARSLNHRFCEQPILSSATVAFKGHSATADAAEHVSLCADTATVEVVASTAMSVKSIAGDVAVEAAADDAQAADGAAAADAVAVCKYPASHGEAASRSNCPRLLTSGIGIFGGRGAAPDRGDALGDMEVHASANGMLTTGFANGAGDADTRRFPEGGPTTCHRGGGLLDEIIDNTSFAGASGKRVRLLCLMQLRGLMSPGEQDLDDAARTMPTLSRPSDAGDGDRRHAAPSMLNWPPNTRR